MSYGQKQTSWLIANNAEDLTSGFSNFQKQFELVVVRAVVELGGLLMVSRHLATKPSCHQQIRHQE